MDDIIDLESEKIDKILQKIDLIPVLEEVKMSERNLWLKIRKKTLQGRRTGVGITAEGDMLASNGPPLRQRRGETISRAGTPCRGTQCLPFVRGDGLVNGVLSKSSKPGEKNNPFILRLKDADNQLYEDMMKHGRRNIACLTIAPTGTTSLMSVTTSGIEPVFLADHAPSQGESQRQGCEDRFRGCEWRLLGGVHRVPPQVCHLDGSKRLLHHQALQQAGGR